jgi:hypothetical protein
MYLLPSHHLPASGDDKGRISRKKKNPFFGFSKYFVFSFSAERVAFIFRKSTKCEKLLK